MHVAAAYRPTEVVMESSRFDVWTRRRVGLAAGGGLAGALISVTGAQVGQAKKKKKKKCCKDIRATCTSDKQCCGNAVCGEREGIENITVCCLPEGQSCSNIAGSQLECCGDLECDGVTLKCDAIT
jgi:hypothetical protein